MKVISIHLSLFIESVLVVVVVVIFLLNLAQFHDSFVEKDSFLYRLDWSLPKISGVSCAAE